MTIKIFESSVDVVKHWWISLVTGIISIILGVFCIISPDRSLSTLTYIFITAFLIDGILEIFFAFSNRKIFVSWGWGFTTGIVELLLGIILLILPQPLMTEVLIFLIGFWILVRSVLTMAESCQLQMLGIKEWGWLFALGMASIVFSFIYLISPMFGSIFVILFVSVTLFIYGLFRILLSFKLRSLNTTMKEAKFCYCY